MYRQSPLLTLPTSLLLLIFTSLHQIQCQTTTSNSAQPLSSTDTNSQATTLSTSTLTSSTASSKTTTSSTRTGPWHRPTDLPSLSFPAPTTTSDLTIPGTPPTNGQSGRPLTPEEQQRDGVVNLYFVFILLAVVLVGLLAWLYYRRKKLRATALRTSRRDALERDLGSSNGGSSPRSLYSWRTRQIRNGGTCLSRRWVGDRGEYVLGLDERGEAPPPYKPKPDEEAGGVELQSPQRAVVRLGADERKPPDYEEHVRAVSSSEGSLTEGSSTRRTSVEAAPSERS